MFRRALTRPAAAAVIAAVALGLGSPALAHMTTFPAEAPAGGYATVYFQVPHGCDGEATSQVAVKLTDAISSVKPEMVPGWTASVTNAPLDQPFESYGQQITEYVDTVTWNATGDPLPDGQFMRFGLVMKVPDLAGEDLVLPAVQTCTNGAQEAWIDPDPEADMPAPRVSLTASGNGHGGSMATAQPTMATVAASEQTSSSTPALVIAVIALIAALASGVVALTARRSS
jgi:uncharacterized protein YcnI